MPFGLNAANERMDREQPLISQHLDFRHCLLLGRTFPGFARRGQLYGRGVAGVQ